MSYNPIASSSSSIPINPSIIMPGSNPSDRTNKYDTTLPIRLDILAALPYLFPPLTGLLILVLETANDYVRFHAWQSVLVFSVLFSANIFIGLISR
jgi:hypothetical protein